MANKYPFSEAVYKKRLEEGRGQGNGSEYIPWIKVYDFLGSRGIKVRVFGWLTGRTHHFLSKLEYYWFLYFSFLPGVVDIKEQYPLLPVSETVEIAERLGIKHPYDKKGKFPIVMTTDLLISQDDWRKPVAYTIKPQELINKKAYDLFRIEKEYFRNRAIERRVCTEISNMTYIRNLRMLYADQRLEDLSEPLASVQLETLKADIFERVLRQEDAATQIAKQLDKIYQLYPGDSMRVIRHMIASQELPVDIKRNPLIMNKMLPLVSRNNTYIGG